MKRFFFLSSLALTMSATALAAPAFPEPVEVELPDGTTATVKLVGDESFHFWTDAAGNPLVKQDDGFFYYVGDSGNPLKFRLGDAAAKHILNAAHREAGIKALEKAADTPRARARKAVASQARQPLYPTYGNGRGLVILVNYTDVKFQDENANEEFTRMLNEPGYSKYNGTGSAADWFKDNSLGQYTPQFDVYGPIELPNPMEYYGGNGDKYSHRMIIHACEILDDEIDFSIYDQNQDGDIDFVFVFFAGYGENLGADKNTVWPHMGDVPSYEGKEDFFDGLRLNHYACTNERNLKDVMDGIGTFCHEFSHVLGLPDLYSLGTGRAFTPGTWSVMDSGLYNNKSRTPPHYSAYERYELGWLNPVELTEAQLVTLPPIAANEAAIIKTSREEEYFLFENRQQTGWDSYIPGHGMLVWHIDYYEPLWKSNSVNNSANHQHVDIEEADGTQSEYNRAGDAFPGTDGITSFTDRTSPGMTNWFGKGTEKPVTKISEKDGIISFSVLAGTEVPAPVDFSVLPATDVTNTSFSANWGYSTLGCSYYLSVYSKDGDELVYVPGFRNQNVGKCHKYNVSGLEPDKEYFYSLRAVSPDLKQFSEPTEEILVTTAPVTFDLLAPAAPVAENIEYDSFDLSWTPMEDAEEYFVNVYTKSPDDEKTEFADFSTSNPKSWTYGFNNVFSEADFSGEAVPAAKFEEDGNYIETGQYPEILQLQFWSMGVETAPSQTLAVDLLTHKGWVRGKDVELIPGNGVNTEMKYLMDDRTAEGPVYAAKILLENSAGAKVAVDDISVIYATRFSRSYIDGLRSASAGNDLHFAITGLEPETQYRANIVARNAEGVYSAESPEIKVFTPTGSGVDSAAVASAELKAYTSGAEITAFTEAPAVAVYNVAGIRIAEVKTIDGKASIQAPVAGLYIVSDGKNARKVIVK